MQPTITIVESQCDWLTVTCTKPDREADFRWWANRLLSQEEREGGKRRDYALRGYVGLRCGRCRFGLRADGEILQLSGDLAREAVHTAVQVADNCSRIDLAVTVRQEPFDDAQEFYHYHDIRGWEGPEGRKPTSTYIESSDGGSTCYVGQRSSDVMLRVYNKEAESQDDHYMHCHRYELEIKGDRSLPTLRALDAHQYPGDYCRGIVFRWASEHGLVPVFNETTTLRIVPGFRRRSDVDTKLRWLYDSVKPTVDWLREFGRGTDASRALGLDHDALELEHSLAANMGIAGRDPEGER